MMKGLEIAEPSSCFNKAQFDELLFILLGRDPAAPVAIEAWVQERIRLGKNEPGDAQIAEALGCALQMRASLGTDGLRERIP